MHHYHLKSRSKAYPDDASCGNGGEQIYVDHMQWRKRRSLGRSETIIELTVFIMFLTCASPKTNKWFISPSTCKTSLCFKLCLTHGKLWVTFQVPGSCILASSRTSVESISISLLPMTTEYNRRGHEGDAINSGLPDK